MNATMIATESQRKYAQLPRGFRWFSEHCVLRQIDEADAARIWQAATHPAFVHCWTTRLPRSHGDVVDFVRRSQSDWLRGIGYTMAVVRKQTQDFVGWIELRAHAGERGAWLLDWFVHPRYLADEVARDVLAAAADLMFLALHTERLYANCPPKHALFEQLLDDAGFSELIPAGSLDHTTGQPRLHSLFSLTRSDWSAAASKAEPMPALSRSFSSTWTAGTLNHELALI